MNEFPDVSLSTWAATKRSLHAYAQMLGKLRVALSPPQPNWLHTALHLDARGFTTGPIPVGLSSFEARVDVFASQLILARSAGSDFRIDLTPARSIAKVWQDVLAGCDALGVRVDLSRLPQEVPSPIPFDEDHAPAQYDAGRVRAWFDAVTATASVFDRWRSHFFGRTAIALWWGAFDVALLLFSGKHVPAPRDRGYLMRYDLDAELLNCGLFLGDEKNAPTFYGYLHPQPEGAPSLPIAPAGARWSDELKEWTLSYDAVAKARDPEAELRAFLDALYAIAIDRAGWDREAHAYDAPPRV